MPHITFYGAAETVTGSKYLLESDQTRLLVDCGLFQGIKKLREMNWQSLPINVATLDAVVLTHAHLDHIGYLPRLVRNGFEGRIYCTPASREIAELILLDSAKNQERDADYANRKGFSKHKPALPLYTSQDVEQTLRLFDTVPRQTWFSPAEPFEICFHDAGHLLGSTMVQVTIHNGKKLIQLLFSGDVGRYDGPLYFDPAPPPTCDYLICESTYGDRDHPETDLLESFAQVIHRAVQRGGVMLIATFAVGRAQQLIYLLQILMNEGRIPELPIHLDSPMSINATKIYRTHCEDHDLCEAHLTDCDSLLDGSRVHLARTVEESKALNHIEGPAIILSSSGMMTGGRILFHLKRRLPDKKTTVILGGFMAAGTRGRHLHDGAETLRIHGQDVPVLAAIDSISGLSGHADRGELLRWLEPLPDPKQVFVTHGEPNSTKAFAERLQQERGWNTFIPKLGDRCELA